MTKLLVGVLLLFLSSIAFSQVADFTNMEQYIPVTEYDSSFINFHPLVTHAQKLGIVGENIYYDDQLCNIDSYKFDINGVIPIYELNCNGKRYNKDLNTENWYLKGGLEKINKEYKGIEFKFNESTDEIIYGLDDRMFSKKDRFIIKDIKYGKISKKSYSLVVFFENGYIESMDFIDFRPCFKSDMKNVASTSAKTEKDALLKLVILVDDEKMLAVQ